jgi:hypothetical protein
MRFDIEVHGAKELRVAYRDAPALVASTSHRVMRRLVGRLHSYVQLRKLSGTPLAARTRNLARSVFSRVELVANDLQGRVGFDLAKAAYARIHEEGGTIRPKHGRFLAIPVGAALTGNGVARFDAREFIQGTQGGGSFRGFTGSFVNKNRTALMGVRKAGTVEAVFALKREVTLPARRPLGETLEENRDDVRRAFETGVVDVVERLKRVG